MVIYWFYQGDLKDPSQRDTETGSVRDAALIFSIISL